MTAPAMTMRVGARRTGSPHIAAVALDDHGLVLPDTSPSFGIALADLLADPVPDARRVAVTWAVTDAVRADDRVHVSTLITRIASDGVTRHVQLVDETGRVRESGTETWRTLERLEPVAALDFCTVAWGELLRDRLHADPAFTSAVSSWDGTIGLRCGTSEVHLRIYKGRVIDVTRRALLGATFVFETRPETWVELMFSVDDDFMRRALRGEFSSSGDGYEYLRLTKPLHAIINHARAMAQEVSS